MGRGAATANWGARKHDIQPFFNLQTIDRKQGAWELSELYGVLQLHQPWDDQHQRDLPDGGHLGVPVRYPNQGPAQARWRHLHSCQKKPQRRVYLDKLSLLTLCGDCRLCGSLDSAATQVSLVHNIRRKDQSLPTNLQNIWNIIKCTFSPPWFPPHKTHLID